MNPSDARAWCRSMLPKVSRTFAACIRLLPRRLEHPVLISYLLCRVADTVEDCPRLDPATKADLLVRFRTALDQEGDDCAAVRAAFPEPANDDEALTARCDMVLAEYRRLSERQRHAIRPWVGEMCDGMADFAIRSGSESFHALATVADLDRYCYYVAGTVGHLLTDLFVDAHRRLTSHHYRRLKALATSFGLGLQLTNIIKDVADDAERGWSFVPRRLCERLGVDPEHLLDPTQRAAAQKVMDHLIAKAEAHLDDALAYCQALPRSAYRMRLFCLTPLYFAIRTLGTARRDPHLLDPHHKVKISRAEVMRILRTTFLVAPNNGLVRSYYRRLAAA